MEEIKKKSRAGGKRAGAGRPKKDDAKTVVTFRIDADLASLVKSKDNKSRFINDCIRQTVSDKS